MKKLLFAIAMLGIAAGLNYLRVPLKFTYYFG